MNVLKILVYEFFKKIIGKKQLIFLQLFIFLMKMVLKLLQNDLLTNSLKAPINMTHF